MDKTDTVLNKTPFYPYFYSVCGKSLSAFAACFFRKNVQLIAI